MNSIWKLSESETFALNNCQPNPGSKVIQLPIHAGSDNMAIVSVSFETSGGSYLSDFVVEWKGDNLLTFVLPSCKMQGQPVDYTITSIRMNLIHTFQKNNTLTFGMPVWLDDEPLTPINQQEDLLIDFLSPRYYDAGDWKIQTSLPAEEAGFKTDWMYGSLWYLQKPGRTHRISIRRTMSVDISPYQAVNLFTATDVRASLTLTAEIDGQTVTLFDRLRGPGGGEESRAAISGNRLTAITFLLEQADEIKESIDIKVATDIRWLAAEKKGASISDAAEVTGMPPVTPPERVDPDSILPIGLFLNQADLVNLRERMTTSFVLQKWLADFKAECDSHLEYQPEPFIGRWLPAHLGNQGVERKVSPGYEMKTWNSMMVYGSFCYAVTGELKYGLMARKALLATVRCSEWQAGFCTRIPAGTYGYRAPFVETHTAESVAICYDLIYGLLSEEERWETEDALYEKALKRCDMFLRLNSEGYLLRSNQGAVYTAGAVLSALVARKRHPQAQQMLDWVIGWFPRMLNTYFRPDGGTNEGPGYWEYTMQYVATSLVAISRYLGVDIQDYAPAQLPRTMEYMHHLRSLARQDLAFLPLGDNIESAGYSLMGCSFLFFAKYYQDLGALWLWHRFCNPPHPPGDVIFGKEVCGACAPAGLLNILFLTEGNPLSPALEPARHFTSCSRFTLRTGSDYGDKLIFFEAGPQTFDHAHFDKGQYLFEAYGERLAADPGTIRYQNPAHRYFLSTSYHNLVTHNGSDQDYKDPAKAVIVNRFSTENGFDILCADLSSSYRILKRYDRTLVFVRPDYLVVFDRAESDESGLEWNFHSCAKLESMEPGEGLFHWKGKAGMTLGIGCDFGLENLVADSGTFADEGQILTHNLRLSSREKQSSLGIVAVMVPYEFNPQRPEVNVDEKGRQSLITVKGNWGEDLLTVDWVEGTLKIIRSGGEVLEL